MGHDVFLDLRILQGADKKALTEQKKTILLLILKLDSLSPKRNSSSFCI